MTKLQILYIVLQGMFLPLVIMFQHAFDTGSRTSVLYFTVYEILIIIDGILAVKLFGGKK